MRVPSQPHRKATGVTVDSIAALQDHADYDIAMPDVHIANATVGPKRAWRTGERLVVVGRTFFAVALTGLAVEHFIFRDFVVGRAPAWPKGFPGGVFWAYLSGIAFIAIAAAIVLRKRARAASIIAAVLIGSWALLRNVPVVIGDSFLSGAWTRGGKALVFTAGALAIAATFPTIETTRNTTVAKVLPDNRIHRRREMVSGPVLLDHWNPPFQVH